MSRSPLCGIPCRAFTWADRYGKMANSAGRPTIQLINDSLVLSMEAAKQSPLTYIV